MTRASLLALCIALIAAAAPGQDPRSGRTDDRAVAGTLPLEEIRAMLANAAAHTPFTPEAPLGIDQDLEALIPADNPLTPAKVELGRQLYFDKRLSRDGTVSCATCHDPAKGWTDNLPVSEGIGGQVGGRSAPTVVNRLLGQSQFWDGRAPSLEAQAVGPIANPIEMGFTHPEVVARLNAIEGYRIQFEAVFGGPATIDAVGKAIASFERTILSGHSKHDYYQAAVPFFGFEPEEDEDPELVERMQQVLLLEEAHRLSAQAERGRRLFFGKAACSTCHAGNDLTDELFHNIGVGYPSNAPDSGRGGVSGVEAETGAFRTPSLRNITRTAPYMHDGSQATLIEVVRHYNKGGNKNPFLSEKIFPLNLNQNEVQDVARFLEEALDGTVTEVAIPRLP